jgi:hypothetical protein
MDSIESLRAILAKSPPPKPSSADKSPPPKQTVSPTAPTAVPQAVPISIPPRPVLQYPSIDVPRSSSASATSSSPPKSSFEYGSSPPRTSTKFGTFFKSFRGRSAFDTDEDEFDGGRKYTTTTLKPESGGEKSKLDRTSFFKADGGRAYRSPSPYPLPTPSPALPNPSPASKPQSKNCFASFNGRSVFNADDDEFDNSRKYTVEPSSSTVVSTRARAISWADQVAKANANPAASSDDAWEQAGLGAKDEEMEKSGSTVSLTEPSLPFAAQLSTKTPRSIGTSQGKRMSATLAAARGISPYQGNMWDPEEDEWMDAAKVVETFKASYKTPPPVLSTPTKGALSYFGTAIQSTVKSVWASKVEKAQEEEERLDELQEKIEELGNGSLCDPKGDANDEVMKSVFLGPTRYFPGQVVHCPRNMHVVDLDKYFQSLDPLISNARPRLCDTIATVLSHTSKECLEAFLDPSIKEFIYRRKVDNNEGGLILIIRREGNEVVCGTYHNFAFKKLWKLYVKSIISITGQWHEVFTTVKPGEMVINRGTPEWGTIQPEMESDKADSKTTQRKLELSPTKKIVKTADDVEETNPKFMLYQSRLLSSYLLWDIWYRFDRMYECRATWAADGKESKVRLKRALVGSDDKEDD